MLDTQSPRPLYEQIKDHILQKIDSGAYEPHARIPSERDLSKQFGVSRLTVSRAIQDLVREGVLYVQIGKGTFISSGVIDQELSSLTSFSEDMARRGHEPASHVLQAEICPAPPNVARALNLAGGLSVVLLKRVRMAQQQPVALETSHVVAACCPGLLERHDFERESLYAALRDDYGLSLTHAEQTIEARHATSDEARVLMVKAGSPILAIVRITYTENDQPLEYVESAYRGDRYKFRARLRHV